MVKMIIEFATFPRRNGRGKDNILGVTPNTHDLNLTELRFKSNAIHTENISKTTGQRRLNAPRLG